jgi:hypothetical protein
MNDPVNLVDPDGMHAANPAMRAAFQRAGVRAGTGLIITQADSPLPGPADVVGVGVIVIAGGLLVWDVGAAIVENRQNEAYETPGGNRIRNHGSRGNGQEYIEGKGHTPGSVDEILDNPADNYPSAQGDTSSGGTQGATVVIGQSGDWVVINDETGEVIAVNDRDNPRQEPPEEREPSDE